MKEGVFYSFLFTFFMVVEFAFRWDAGIREKRMLRK